VGVIPNDAGKANEGRWSEFVAADSQGVVAREKQDRRYRDRTPFPQQQEWFRRTPRVARRLRGLRCHHCRNAERESFETAQETWPCPFGALLNFFTGNVGD